MRQLNLKWKNKIHINVRLYTTRRSMNRATHRVCRIGRYSNITLKGMVAVALTVYKSGKAARCIIVYLNEEDYTYETVVHECYHAVVRTRQRHRSFYQGSRNEESFAQELGALVNIIANRFGSLEIETDGGPESGGQNVRGV